MPTRKNKRPQGTLWHPRKKLLKAEEAICKRLKRTGRLFAFLRKHRRKIFDDKFQAELAEMYSDTPRGTQPRPPAFLAMVVLLQAYEKKSDAAAVEEAVFDRRWQMVLDCLGADEPPFSQGSLVDFRRRLMAHDMDKRLLDRTVEVAKESGDFGYKQLRIALDSSPLWGAGRVEDTFNLIGHALEVVVDCAASVLGVGGQAVCKEAQLTLLGGSSLKALLDIDWDDAQQQHGALQRLLDEVVRLRSWLTEQLGDQVDAPPLKEALALLEQVLTQDLEPDPGGGGMRVRRGVAKDRRISVTDPQMRHGRKSKTRLFNGYKRHIARDVDSGFILAGLARPANEPEYQATEQLRQDIEPFGEVDELHIDRGYLASEWVRQRYQAGMPVYAKPWTVRNGKLFPKTAFNIDLEAGQVRCPEGITVPFKGKTARFPARACDACPSRGQCTRAKMGRGRTISIHPQEAFFVQLRQLKQTSEGRAKLRQRVCVEHTLAHVCRRQGPRARYLGTRKNTFDVRRVAAIENLNVLDRLGRVA